MAKLRKEKVKPIPENVEKYTAIYEEYKILHDYFGTGVNDVMKRLKTIKNNASKE